MLGAINFSILLKHHISKEAILLRSAFLTAHVLHPLCYNRKYYIVFIIWIWWLWGYLAVSTWFLSVTAQILHLFLSLGLSNLAVQWLIYPLHNYLRSEMGPLPIQNMTLKVQCFFMMRYAYRYMKEPLWWCFCLL